MRLDHPLLTDVAGLLGSRLIKGWMRTLDLKIAYHDPAADPAFPVCRRQGIYIFWHEYITFPLYLRGHCDLAMLLSRHRDADLLTRFAKHFGFSFVRGSSNRGGVAALRTLLETGRRFHLTITPDGPRGPRRKLAVGPVYLASRLQLPLVLLGLGYDRPWRTPTWDRFAIPRPYTRGRCILSSDLWIPPDLDRDGLETHRLRIEELLNALSEEAEQWALSGRYVPGQAPLFPGKADPNGLFASPSQARIVHEKS